jgi:hypothetical protein
MLGVQRRLRDKLGAAASITATPDKLLPGLSSAYEDSPARHLERMREKLFDWRKTRRRTSQAAPAIAAVCAANSGWVAAVRVADGTTILVARVGDRVGDDPSLTLRALCLAEGDDIPIVESVIGAAKTCAVGWCESRAALFATGARVPMSGDLRQRALRRIASITARASVQRRHEVARLASRARRIANAQLGAGDEMELVRLVDGQSSDESWLEALGTFAEFVPATKAPGTDRIPAEILALIVFG